MFVLHGINGTVLLSDDTLEGAVKAAISNGCDMHTVNLAGAHLPGAVLRNMHAPYAYMHHANLREADLSEAHLNSAVLTGADLRCAKLRKASLVGANLSHADLTGSDLRGADLRQTTLSSACLGGAIYDKHTCWPAPPMVLLANWGEVSRELRRDLMRYDCANHPGGKKAFLNWKDGGVCPYYNSSVERSALFVQKATTFTPGPAPSAYRLMRRLLRAKCNLEK